MIQNWDLKIWCSPCSINWKQTYRPWEIRTRKLVQNLEREIYTAFWSKNIFRFQRKYIFKVVTCITQIRNFFNNILVDRTYVFWPCRYYVDLAKWSPHSPGSFPDPDFFKNISTKEHELGKRIFFRSTQVFFSGIWFKKYLVKGTWAEKMGFLELATDAVECSLYGIQKNENNLPSESKNVLTSKIQIVKIWKYYILVG